MRIMRFFVVLMFAGILAAGCSPESTMTTPDNQVGYDKNGTEELGLPSIPVADGSGFVEGGVGMVDTDTGNFDVTVPAGATVVQAFLYWEGGTTSDNGDDTISVNGNSVTGELIGGPTNFFENYNFYAYRADITAEGWVVPGLNSFEITDFDFDFSASTLDENNGAGILVVYDDGSMADLSLFDGLDMAYFNFAGTLNSTVPKTFTFNAEGADRVADLVVFAGSVGVDRPNQIKVTTIAGDQIFDNVLGSAQGLLWDSHVIVVDVPAGATELTVELISVNSSDPRGASMAWIGTGLAVPVNPLYCLGDRVWYDSDCNGCQDEGERGAMGVTVNLYEGCTDGVMIGTTTTDETGYYEFCELMPGDYMVEFVAPDGYEFSPQYATACGFETDSNAGEGGMTDCITIVDADDWTIDAGLCMPEEGCTLTIGKWKNWTGLGNGNQEDIVSQYLPVYLGDMGGAKTLDVTTVEIAVDVLKMKTYGRNNNGITKLYAQLLAAKLNFAAGASDGAVADYVTDADAFLADHDYMDWDGLSDDDKDMVMMWQGSFDAYNNGDIGPGHCEDDDDDEPMMFK